MIFRQSRSLSAPALDPSVSENVHPSTELWHGAYYMRGHRLSKAKPRAKVYMQGGKSLSRYIPTYVVSENSGRALAQELILNIDCAS